MAKITDPAAEFATLLEELAVSSNDPGSKFLASKFEVEEWSLEFYQIIFSIVQRIEYIKNLVSSFEEFQHLQHDISNHLETIKLAFTVSGLRSTWNTYGLSRINATHVQPIKMTSAFLRGRVSYPDLSDEERQEIVDIASDLLAWLKEHQLEENDFIRNALIEGLEAFVFRLERLRWLGWGYSLETLKAVILAYNALARNDIKAEDAPITATATKKLASGLRKIFNAVGVSKDVVERADFALKAYGALTLAIQGQSGVSGLLN